MKRHRHLCQCGACESRRVFRSWMRILASLAAFWATVFGLIWWLAVS